MRPHALIVGAVAAAMVADVSAVASFSASQSGAILRDGSPVVLRGFAVTCMEYLLRGIGTSCLAQYDYSNPSKIITTLDTTVVDAMFANLLPAPPGVQPGIRVALTAAYYLDVSTSAWSSARGQYPGLSQQYVALIDALVQYASAKGVVTILDLHWNDDVTEQQNMALRASGASSPTGDSVAFWTSLATKYASNPMVWYELYNEPHGNSQSLYANGGGQYEGMLPMASAIAQFNPKGLVLIAGSQDYAYDSTSLVSLSSLLPAGLSVAWTFHPYMGPYQQGDSAKTVTGFANMLANVALTNRPIVATELGQYCCPSNGPCYAYSGTYNGQAMGYVQALFTLMIAQNVSFTPWAWRPGQGGDCNQPDLNSNNVLASATSQGGADWATLWPWAFNGGSAPAPTAPVSSAPTTTLSPTSLRGSTSAPVGGPATNAPTLATKSPTLPTKTPTSKPTSTKAPSKPTSTKAPSTKAPATTLRPTTSRPTPATAPCGAVWSQCGGQSFTGPTTCCAGSLCTAQSQYYSQCIPQTQPPASASNCAAVYSQCGGQGFTGLTTCCAGSSCTVSSPYYSQCLPAKGV